MIKLMDTEDDRLGESLKLSFLWRDLSKRPLDVMVFGTPLNTKRLFDLVF